MASKNDITGDVLQSRMNTKAFEENFDRIFRRKETFEELAKSVKENETLLNDLSRIDTIGQNGNDGFHYEYELNKSTGELEKRFTEGISKPNESQFNGD